MADAPRRTASFPSFPCFPTAYIGPWDRIIGDGPPERCLPSSCTSDRLSTDRVTDRTLPPGAGRSACEHRTFCKSYGGNQGPRTKGTTQEKRPSILGGKKTRRAAEASRFSPHVALTQLPRSAPHPPTQRGGRIPPAILPIFSSARESSLWPALGFYISAQFVDFALCKVRDGLLFH